MGKFISSEQLTSTLTMSECSDGFWLYDKTRGINLSMRAKTPTDAFIEALDYYQRRLLKVEEDYASLHKKVEVFVEGVVKDFDGELA